MSYHFKGKCITCQEPVEFLSARRGEHECVNCQYFKPKVKLAEKQFSTNLEFWNKFPEGPRGCVWYETDRRGKTTRRVDRARFDPLAKQYAAAVWKDQVVWKDSAGMVRMAMQILSCNPEGLGEWRKI